MWTRYICCILLCIIVALAIAAGVLASQFKPPSIDMNGVAPDPNGLPAFQRAADLSFTINLGLKFGVNNPNVESLTLASVSTKVKSIYHCDVIPFLTRIGTGVLPHSTRSCSSNRLFGGYPYSKLWVDQFYVSHPHVL